MIYIADNILIIEDDPFICEELIQFLGYNGYNPWVMDFNKNVVDTIKKMNLDLSLLDVNLSNQDGFFYADKLGIYLIYQLFLSREEIVQWMN